MQFPKKTSREFHELFMTIIKKGANNNTYKFALALFLLEHSRSGPDRYEVPYEEIAGSFLKYYWSHVCKSKLRQGPENQVPKVVDIIRTEFDKDVYPMSFSDLKKDEPGKVQNCIGMITKKCFKDVVPRFQWIDGRNHRVFYNYWSKEYHDSARNERLYLDRPMQLNPKAVDFFRRNFAPLYNSVILEWVKFLESINFGAPNLAKKVEARVRGPRDQRKFVKTLRPFSKTCFYCGEDLKFDKTTHVDHVLPYDYIGETEMWNAVLACQQCNCAKLDRLPPRRFVDALIEQNREYYPKIEALRKSVARFHRGHLAEDQISQDAVESLKRNLEWHYRSAAGSGYPKMGAFQCRRREQPQTSTNRR